MSLTIDDHKRHLAKILIEIAADKSLTAKIGFKGGTALFFFENLDRFSTDLDFDLIGEGNQELQKKIERILEGNLNIVDKKLKRFTWFWLGSYEKGQMKIKFELNTRQYHNEYEVREFRGYSLRVMKRGYMMAHKLCAVTDRKTLQNRDLYDLWWMMKHDFPVAEEIIKDRMGVPLTKYWGVLLKLVRGLPPKYDILQGLGEVMTPAKKDWVKSKLLDELTMELASRAGE